MTIINLTPHPVTINGVTIPSTGLARAREEIVFVGEVDGVQLANVRYGDVEGLPDPEPGTVYVVSLIVMQALPDRKDLARPGGLIRDEQGRVIGAKYLILE